MSLGTIILIILIIALLGGFSGVGGGPFYGTGYYGGGGLGLIVVILLILLLLGRLSARHRRVGKGALAPCPPLLCHRHPGPAPSGASRNDGVDFPASFRIYLGARLHPFLMLRTAVGPPNHRR